MITNLQLWLFGILLNNLKQKFVDGTANLRKLIDEKELFAFTKLFTRRQSFVREVRQVNVKKGTRRYTLLFVTTKDGTTRFNLGRHFDLTKGYLSGKPVLELEPRHVFEWQKTQEEQLMMSLGYSKIDD
jgi:hypothetical protein